MCKKIIYVFLILIISLNIIFSIPVFAGQVSNETADGGESGATSNPNYDETAFESGDSGSAGTSIENATKSILYFVRTIAIGIGLIMLTILAMKYMLASAQERATIKQNAVVYVVGALVLFGASGILTIIDAFVTNNLQ